MLIDQFTSGDTRQEDMECDPVTFAPTEVMWVRTTPQGGAFPDVITAFEIEPDTCNLAQINPQPVQKSKEKRLLEAVIKAGGMSVIHFGLSVACGATTAGLCAPVLFTILTYMGLAEFTLKVRLILLDPPDPEFNMIFVPNDYPPPLVVPGPDLSNEVANLANSAFADLTDLYELTEAWLVTLERYRAAVLSGEEEAAQSQLAALEGYVLAASEAASFSADSVQSLLTALGAISGSVPISQPQLEAGLADLAANGFPALGIEVLSNLGVSDQQMDEMLAELLSQNLPQTPTLAAAVTDLIDSLVVLSEVAATTIPTRLDIRPGDNPNSINPRSRGTIPVAILSTADFDAPFQVDESSLTFGSIGNEDSLDFCAGSEDVNTDGLLDLVCHFDTQATGFQPGDTAGILMGKTIDGTPIQGGDAVRIVGR